MLKPVWFWKDLFPLIVAFCKREGLSFNEAVNLAVQSFLGTCSVSELRLKAKLACLLREEAELRRVSSCMLRSGAYLPGYAQRVLKEPKGRPQSPFTYSREDSDKPLRALSASEEKVFRKICTRREEIALKVSEIQSELLRNVKPFRLEFERSESSADDTKTKNGDNHCSGA